CLHRAPSMPPSPDFQVQIQHAAASDVRRTCQIDNAKIPNSHTGQFTVSGNTARDWLNRMLTNNVAKLGLGTGQYTFLLNDRGGVIDDLIIYRTGDAEFFLVVNAARVDEDFGWLQKHKLSDLVLRNCSLYFGSIA